MHHYIKVPENHIVIDFDIKNKDVNNCLERNIKEDIKWPANYTVLYNSGNGAHIHYICNGT